MNRRWCLLAFSLARACPRLARRPRTPSAASTSPRPEPTSSTRARASSWCVTATAPSSPWRTTTAATPPSSRWWCRSRPSSPSEQIHVGERAVLDHLDAFTSPRLVEYYDANPCAAARASRARRHVEPRLRPRRRREASAGAAEEPRRAHRGQVQRRRVRDPDPVRQGEPGARDLAAHQRLQRARRAPPRCCAATCARVSTSSSPRSTSSASASSASSGCARCRWPTRARASCCPSASAWSTPTGRRSSSSSR